MTMAFRGAVAASCLIRPVMGALVGVVLASLACEPASFGVGSNGHLVWVDATGAFVSDDFPRFTDANGMHWPINIETGRVEPLVGGDLFYYRFYRATDCTGPAQLLSILGPPRRVFAAADEYVTRADDVEANAFAYGSMVVGGGACTVVTDPSADAYASFFFIPESALRRLGTTAPALSFMPPLHQEVR